MLSKYSACLFICVAFSASTSVYAEAQSNVMPYSNMTDQEVNQYVKKITQNKRIMEAQLELQKILKQTSELSTNDTESPQIEPPNNLSTGMSSMFRKKTQVEPSVISIEGPKKRLVALLKVGSDNILRVREGDNANGWKINQINAQGVVASKEGETKLLPFSVMDSTQLNNPDQPY